MDMAVFYNEVMNPVNMDTKSVCAIDFYIFDGETSGVLPVNAFSTSFSSNPEVFNGYIFSRVGNIADGIVPLTMILATLSSSPYEPMVTLSTPTPMVSLETVPLFCR